MKTLDNTNENNILPIKYQNNIFEDILNKIKNSSCKIIEIILEKNEDNLDASKLNLVFSATKPGTELKLILNNNLKGRFANELKMNVKFSGFKSTTMIEENNCIVIKAVNKSFNKDNNQILNISDNKSLANKWNIDNNKEVKYINENNLINPNDLYEKFSKNSDCITKPKPCKNCNCGRAANNINADNKSIENLPKSDCGKCYMGDAFRCEGCPYRGLPAFEKGQKIVLNSEDNLLKNNVKENQNINVDKNNKVKIEL